MFELSLARKYLIPTKKQLSVSLIGLLASFVISLVVWLVIVFLSITDGMEKGWLERLCALNAPLRMTPTEAYFSSYYYQIDQESAGAHFQTRTIGEKFAAKKTDPYNPEEDPELPAYFPKSSNVDIVKETYATLAELERASFQEYELTGALLRIQMVRQNRQNQLSQATYLASLADNNPSLSALILAPEHSLHFESSPEITPHWVHTVKGKVILPANSILLPKGYLDSGVAIGDSATLSFPSVGATAAMEERIDLTVAGFYDPGIMAVGNRIAIISKDLTHLIAKQNRSNYLDRASSNGIQIWLPSIHDAVSYKQKIEQSLKVKQLDTYWKVTTFREYEFAKELLEQFQSDKTLFTLIATIILLVACSNIVALLLLLVSNKKKEIGILLALGATPQSIAWIFCLSGALVGSISCLIGTVAAKLTLANIDSIISFLSVLQGHPMLHAAFYGKTLPHEISMNALLFVLIATPLLSLLAGLIPARAASRLSPSAILRGE